MASSLPYVNLPGILTKILEKAKEAKTPDRFTIDFLQTKLGFKGGNYKQFIPFAKKIGLLNADGTPTDLYKQYRNPSTSGIALATAIKIGYKDIFDRNEFANILNKEQIKGLIVEITGLDSANRVVQLTCQTYETIKKLANFDEEQPKTAEQEENEPSPKFEDEHSSINKGLKLGLSYTINLVLPKTDDPAVFNAIFKALRDNLLRN